MTFKIGLLGGSFDPPHIVHLLIAQYVLATTPMDEVWFVPAMQNPLKDQKPVSFEHRMIMCERMIHGIDGLDVCRVERKMGPGPHYTIEVIERLQDDEDYEFSWIIGSDILSEIHKWHRIHELVHKTSFIVLSRDSHSLGPLASSKLWAQHFQSLILDMDFPNISSTEIRARVLYRHRMESWVHKDVLNHIRLHHLYEES